MRHALKKPSRLIQSIEDSKFYDEIQNKESPFAGHKFMGSQADPSSARFENHASVDAENSFWAAVQGNKLEDSLMGPDPHMNI